MNIETNKVRHEANFQKAIIWLKRVGIVVGVFFLSITVGNISYWAFTQLLNWLFY